MTGCSATSRRGPSASRRSATYWKSSSRGRQKVMQATSGTAVVTLQGETEMLVTREFNAPKHLVYKAYTTPELVRRWWAGKQGEMTLAEIDLRVGGMWRYVMIAT